MPETHKYKRLPRTLDGVWRECRAMWHRIAARVKEGSTILPSALKQQWLTEHGYDKDNIANECFFCEWARQHNNYHKVWVDEPVTCRACPGKQVEPDFCCERAYGGRYTWYLQPEEFTAYLDELDARRRR